MERKTPVVSVLYLWRNKMMKEVYSMYLFASVEVLPVRRQLCQVAQFHDSYVRHFHVPIELTTNPLSTHLHGLYPSWGRGYKRPGMPASEGLRALACERVEAALKSKRKTCDQPAHLPRPFDVPLSLQSCVVVPLSAQGADVSGLSPMPLCCERRTCF